jgi:MerR family transcriptional regulator, copper efflux regulator
MSGCGGGFFSPTPRFFSGRGVSHLVAYSCRISHKFFGIIRLRQPKRFIVLPKFGNLVVMMFFDTMESSGMGPMPELGEYLRIKQAAEYLGVCQNTLRNWEAAGKISVLRHPVNNYRLFKVSDLEGLLASIEKPQFSCT